MFYICHELIFRFIGILQQVGDENLVPKITVISVTFTFESDLSNDFFLFFAFQNTNAGRFFFSTAKCTICMKKHSKYDDISQNNIYINDRMIR